MLPCMADLLTLRRRLTAFTASKLVNVIKVLYTALTAAFHVTSSAKQGCILSPVLFILAIDWDLKQDTSCERRGIR